MLSLTDFSPYFTALLENTHVAPASDKPIRSLTPSGVGEEKPSTLHAQGHAKDEE